MTATARRSSSAWRWVNLPWITLIWLYKLTLSPLMGGHCRFVPSCSTYALGVFQTQPPLRAGWLVARRISRCHPWGGGGYDPPPPRADDPS